MAAIDRGAILAQTYQIPQQQPFQQQPVGTTSQQSKFVDEVGDPLADLQQVDQVTSDYFDKWAQLKGFAREVQSTMGIDVRYPDPSVPESNRLHRIYLKALADLKAQGERLKTGQKMLVADRQRGALINKPTTGQYYDELNVGTDIVDSKLDPIVEAANRKLTNYFYGNSIEEAKNYYNQTKAMLEKRRDAEPQLAGYWQRQIDSLVTPTKGVREFAPRTTSTTDASINAAGVHLKKVANMMLGTADGYKLSSTDFGPNGERVYINKDMTGITYGGKPITEWQHIPKTGETAIIAGGQRIPLSGADATTVAKAIVSENPRFAIDGKYIDMYAQNKGYFGETGEINPSALVDDSIVESVTSKRLTDEANEDSVATDEARKSLEKEISTLKPSSDKGWGLFGWTDDRFEGVTEQGHPIKIAVRDAGNKYVYDIENMLDIIGHTDAKGKRRNASTFKTLSKSKLLDILTELGVHFQFKQTPQQKAAQAKPSGPEVATEPIEQQPSSNRQELL